MKFQKIDFETWPRAIPFNHFFNEMPCVTNLTVDLDVTDFMAAIKKKGLKFFPTMLWAVSSAVNQREELRMGCNENGEPGIWDYVSPSYAHFNKEDETFIKLATEYTPDFEEFCRRFEGGKTRYDELEWFDSEGLPPNVFDVSSMPWTHFKNYNLQIFDPKFSLAPVIVWGKYEEDWKGRLKLPVSISVHHAAADGFHMARFFADLEEWLGKFI